MAIGLFKKPYTVRKYGEQTVVKGYASAPIQEDVILRLDVQQLSPDDLLSLPEGERTVKRIKSYGGGKLTAADETTGVRGDMLFYRDQWYECVSSFLRENTLLRFYTSQFVLIPHKQQPAPPSDDMKTPESPESFIPIPPHELEEEDEP